MDAALSTDELVLKPRDLIAQGVATPGPAMGALVRAMFEAVLVDPSRNHVDALLALARERGAAP